MAFAFNNPYHHCFVLSQRGAYVESSAITIKEKATVAREADIS